MSPPTAPHLPQMVPRGSFAAPGVPGHHRGHVFRRRPGDVEENLRGAQLRRGVGGSDLGSSVHALGNAGTQVAPYETVPPTTPQELNARFLPLGIVTFP